MYIHVTFWANPFIYFIVKITSEGARQSLFFHMPASAILFFLYQPTFYVCHLSGK